MDVFDGPPPVYFQQVVTRQRTRSQSTEKNIEMQSRIQGNQFLVHRTHGKTSTTTKSVIQGTQHDDTPLQQISFFFYQ